jgi:hypothetical protein
LLTQGAGCRWSGGAQDDTRCLVLVAHVFEEHTGRVGK